MIILNLTLDTMDMKLNDLETLILAIQDMVTHNINTVWSVAGIILALVALTGFSSIKNTINKRFEEEFQDNGNKYTMKIKEDVVTEFRKELLPSYVVSFFDGIENDANNPVKVNVNLTNNTLIISGSALVLDPKGYVMHLPANVKKERSYVFVVAGQDKGGVLKQVFLELRGNSIYFKSKVQEGTRIYFNDILIYFEEFEM